MTDKHYGRCPKCASKEIQRSRRRNMFERAISSVMLPWRCNVCYARFFRPFWFKAEPRRIDVRRHVEKKSDEKKKEETAGRASARLGLTPLEQTSFSRIHQA